MRSWQRCAHTQIHTHKHVHTHTHTHTHAHTHTQTHTYTHQDEREKAKRVADDEIAAAKARAKELIDVSENWEVRPPLSSFKHNHFTESVVVPRRARI